MKRISTLILLFCCVVSFAQNDGQPCLEGWNYKLPVTIAISDTLSHAVVKLSLETAGLKSSGKLKSNLADIRVLDVNSNHLPFWIEDTTEISDSTNIWVRVHDFQANQVFELYVFYGANHAAHRSNASAVFDFYDGFDDGIINTNIWQTIGNGNISEVNGSLSLSAIGNNLNDQACLLGLNTFNYPISLESGINNADIGLSSIGCYNTDNNLGYTLTYEEVGINTSMRIMRQSFNGTNFSLTELPAFQAEQAVNITGNWSLAWPTQNEQFFDWPGNNDRLTRIDNQVHSNKQAINILASGSANTNLIVDWIGVRPFLSVEPAVEFGQEQNLILPQLEIEYQANFCIGDSINIIANFHPNAIYEWTLPDSTKIFDRRIDVFESTLNDAGNYTLLVTDSAGCNVQRQQIQLNAFEQVVAGVLEQDSTVCLSGNNGLIRVDGASNSPLYWESSSNGAAPWQKIDIQSDTLLFNNLIENQTYRAIIGNGICTSIPTNDITITVIPNAQGGFTQGTSAICAGEDAEIRVRDFEGSIAFWQHRSNNQSAWFDIVSIENPLIRQNEQETTQYRAVIIQGSCDTAFSEIHQVEVFPFPTASFDVNDVCQGNQSIFNQSSTVGAGQITNFQWDFGNGVQSNSRTPRITYGFASEFTVSLTVTTDLGCADDTTVRTSIYAVPEANFEFDELCFSDSTEFTNQSIIANGLINEFEYSLETSTISDQPNFKYQFTTASVHDVQLRVISDLGCRDSITKSVSIKPLPIANFKAEGVCHNFNTIFENLSTDAPNNYQFNWDFGDLNQSNLESPSYKYAEPGEYLVNLLATTEFGCMDDTSLFIEVYPNPQVDFSSNALNYCLNEPTELNNLTQFDGDSISYTWILGDGDSSNQISVVHTYQFDGYYGIDLIGISNSGCSDQQRRFVTVHPLPEANFSGAPVCLTDTTRLRNESKISKGGLDADWIYEAQSFSNVFNAETVLDSAGFHEIKLIITSEAGCKDSIQHLIEVYPNPIADFTVESVCRDERTFFVNTTQFAKDGSRYFWTLGDNTSKVEVSPSHIYLNEGSYPISLAVTNEFGCVHDTSKIAIVHPLPIASFVVDNVCIGEANTFTNESITTSDLNQFLWQFKDGDTSVSENTAHTYENSGIYSPQLTVTTEFGCKDSTSEFLAVYRLPELTISNDTVISLGHKTQIKATGGSLYNWSPTDGLVNTEGNLVTALPKISTEYTVVVEDTFGCINDTSMKVEVRTDYLVYPYNILTPNNDGANDTWVIPNLENYPNHNIEIFDANGRSVFYTNQYENDWRGDENGDLLPDGVYYYIIQLNEAIKTYKGSITLLRN